VVTKKITMPQLGESITEGTINSWLVEEGDHVNKYDPIADIMTDKVNAEVPTFFSGVIKEIVTGEGETIEVEVLSVDRDNERISLSRKNLLPGPWKNIEEKVSSGDVMEGTVKRLVNFGAFVEVLPGVEGLIHISQIANRHIGTPQEVLEEGQQVSVKVLDINEQEERMSLSIKELEKEKETKEIEEYEKDDDQSGFQLGDFIGDQLNKYKN